jgi:hypothetical protein
MKECIDKGEVRYFGLNRVDERLVEYSSDSKNKPMTRDKVFIKMSALKIKLKKMKIVIADAQKDSDKKKTAASLKKLEKLKETFNKKADEFNVLVKLFDKLDKEKEDEEQPVAKRSVTKKTIAKKISEAHEAEELENILTTKYSSNRAQQAAERRNMAYYKNIRDKFRR